MKKIKIFKKKYPAPEKMVHGSHSKEDKLPAPEKMVHGKHSADIKEQKQKDEMMDYLLTPQNNHLLDRPPNNYDDHADQINSKLDRYQNYQGLSNPEKKSVRAYTTKSSFLNSTLLDNYRTNTPVDTVRSYNGAYITDLDPATKKFTLPKMSLFHGTSFDPTKIGKQTNDGHYIVHIPSFLSTSYDHKNTATMFATPHYDESGTTPTHKNMLEIKVPEGHPGLHVGNRSYHPQENEVLLPRGITFKIKATPTQYNRPKGMMAFGLNVWEAHPVPDGEDPETWQPPK